MAKKISSVPCQKIVMTVKKEGGNGLKSIVMQDDLFDALKILTADKKRNNFGALALWEYMAKNNFGYEYALSYSDVHNLTGLGEYAYRSGIKTLIECGFLVPIRENTNHYQFIANPLDKEGAQYLNDMLPEHWQIGSSPKEQHSTCCSPTGAPVDHQHPHLLITDRCTCWSPTGKEEKDHNITQKNIYHNLSSNVINMNDGNDDNSMNSMNDMNNENYSNIKELMGSFSFSNEKEKQETKTSNEVLFLNKNIENKKVAANPSIRDYGKIINGEYNGKMISKLWMKNEPQIIEDNTLGYMSKCDNLELTIEMANSIIENKIENEIAENVTLLDYMNDSCAKDRIAAKNFANFLLEGYSKENIAEVM